VLNHFRYSTIDCGEQYSSEWLSVMIVYEDRLTYRVVERISDRLVIEADLGCSLRLTLRSFDALAVPCIGQLAAREASEADLVLLSIYERGSWPPAVAKWMEWMGEQTAQHGGMAALLVKSSDYPPAADERRDTLERTALISGRDFFIAKEVLLRKPNLSDA
jgi:hypothetical protein